jgi:hypothetical protein
MLKRIIKVSFICQLILGAIIFVFTKNIFYSIIFLFGGILSICGFLLTIKMTDRIIQIEQKRGQGMFFLAGGLKLVIIFGGFFLVSRISETAVLLYIFGISMIPLAIFIEGGYQLYRSISNGRT